jgi:hypothetical protein
VDDARHDGRGKAAFQVSERMRRFGVCVGASSHGDLVVRSSSARESVTALGVGLPNKCDRRFSDPEERAAAAGHPQRAAFATESRPSGDRDLLSAEVPDQADSAAAEQVDHGGHDLAIVLGQLAERRHQLEQGGLDDRALAGFAKRLGSQRRG